MIDQFQTEQQTIHNLSKSEGSIIFLVAAIQFINILDFMMVMPLGPDFAADLGIATSHLGAIGGIYTAAAAASGLVCSTFIERFDRRTALGLSVLGLVVGTLAGGFAFNLTSLLWARALAGVFGGPVTSLSLAIIADVVPPHRRGQAIGKFMGAFAVASVFGVPVGLELAHWGNWRTPFFAVSALALVVNILVMRVLPPMRLHLQNRANMAKASLREMMTRPSVLASFCMTATAMMSIFIVIPNIATYVQNNLGYPREHMGLLYMGGGVISFITTQIAGRFVDRFGSFAIGTFGSGVLLFVLYFGFAHYIDGMPVVFLFMSFMMSTALRNVSFSALTTRVPRMNERASFMSMQSALQHMSSACGAFLSSVLLTEGVGGALVGMETISYIAMFMTCFLPGLLWYVQRSVQKYSPPLRVAA